MPEQLSLTESPDEHIHWTGHVGYNSTPGHRPTDRRNVAAVGDLVTVTPAGFVRNPEWTGRITSHMHWRDGSYTGLSVAECTDVGDFTGYLVVGNGYQVEAAHMHPAQNGDGENGGGQ